MQIEGITANSVDIYLKQVEENSRGEKIALWNKLLSNGTNAKDYKSIMVLEYKKAPTEFIVI